MQVNHRAKNRKINVDRQELLVKLKQNLELHKELYAEAVKGYEAEKTVKLRTLAGVTEQAAKHPTEENRKQVHVAYRSFSSLERPTDNSESFLVAIDVFTWEKDEIVELPLDEFQCYVRNEWDWIGQFRGSVAAYAGDHSHRL